MSSTASSTSEPTDSSHKRQRLARYLREEASDGEFYFKSKFIADEVDLSPSEIGALVGQLQESASDLDIEKWGYTGATTWRVEPV